jgi:diguanylate cyclase (GGDEF)-like protein
MTDGLTGCAVHRVFHQRFEEEIARSLRNGHPLSLMMIDVDSFKAVNDTYGHLVGDHVLAAIGQALRQQSRSFDLVGRLGGDEFAVLMPDTEPSAALALAERIRLEAAAGLEVPVTLSIGVSGLDLSEPTVEHMLDDADFSLYQVKGAGRDGVALRYAQATARPLPQAETAPRS